MSEYQKSDEYKRRIAEAEKVKRILTKWNPLGSRSIEIEDLENYQTEANDIIFHIKTPFHFPKRGNKLLRAQKIIKEVLNEAFNLHLADSECIESAKLIMEIIDEK